MIKKLSPKKVVIVEMVEHPGGHDGGEFAQEHIFGIADDGTAYYQTDFPSCPTDVFCDEEADEYLWATDHEEARIALENAFVEAGVEFQKNPLYQQFCEAESVTVYFGSEDEVETLY